MGQVEALRDCAVPVAAAVYAQDLYVERSFSEETAELLGLSRSVSPGLALALALSRSLSLSLAIALARALAL